MKVLRRGGYGGVAEHLLQRPLVHASPEEMGRQAVTKDMGVQPGGRYARRLSPLLENPPHILPGQGKTPPGQEEPVAPLSRQLRATPFEVVPHPDAGLAEKGDHPLLVPLPLHEEEAGGEVQARGPQGTELARPETASIGHLEERPVPASGHPRRSSSEEAAPLPFAEYLRQPLLLEGRDGRSTSSSTMPSWRRKRIHVLRAATIRCRDAGLLVPRVSHRWKREQASSSGRQEGAPVSLQKASHTRRSRLYAAAVFRLRPRSSRRYPMNCSTRGPISHVVMIILYATTQSFREHLSQYTKGRAAPAAARRFPHTLSQGAGVLSEPLANARYQARAAKVCCPPHHPR